jgi:hypothetical protein
MIGEMKMARKTIAQKVIEERKANGQKLLGRTSGTYSFRKGSNLSQALVRLNLTEDDVDVRTGARAGRHKNDGYELLIFSKSN